MKTTTNLKEFIESISPAALAKIRGKRQETSARIKAIAEMASNYNISSKKSEELYIESLSSEKGFETLVSEFVEGKKASGESLSYPLQ